MFPKSLKEELPWAAKPSVPVATVPLVVDLDGTLIAGDSLVESVLVLIKQRPESALLLPIWLLRGKAKLKSEVGRRVRLAPQTLPYRAQVIAFLQEEKESGRRLILATASHRTVAEAVAAHLKLFDEVVATDDSFNREGVAKRDELVRRFGVRGFDYIGDHRADEPVWAASRLAHVAGPSQRLAQVEVAAGMEAGRVFVGPTPSIRTWFRALRLQQWAKNVLIFLPLLLAYRLSVNSLIELLLTFLSLSFLASATYIINDLFDLGADREHPVKRCRPFASGELTIPQGLAAVVMLAGIALGLGGALGIRILVCLLLYLTLTLAYSCFLKHKPILDVTVLAFLYTLRLILGGFAGGVRISPWLFQLSIFLFLSLAFVKRYSELHRLSLSRGDARARGYQPGDLNVISQAGIASGMLAVLVLALYVNSADVQLLYASPEVLWGVCPIFIYWILRVWLIARRGKMNEDPMLFAFRDKVSYLAGALILGLAVMAHVH